MRASSLSIVSLKSSEQPNREGRCTEKKHRGFGFAEFHRSYGSSGWEFFLLSGSGFYAMQLPHPCGPVGISAGRKEGPPRQEMI